MNFASAHFSAGSTENLKLTVCQEHPWVTKNGTDPLLSAEENTADLVEPPSEIEVKHAITAKMRNLVIMVSPFSYYLSIQGKKLTNSQMTAVQNFKSLLDHKQPNTLSAVLRKGTQII